MNNHFSSRRAACGLLQCLLLCFTCTILVMAGSCSRKVMSSKEAEKWIAGYAPSVVDRESKIRIELTDCAKLRADTTRSLDKLISFSPSIKGKAVFADNGRYIDFVPAKAMKENRMYECRVKMKELTGIDTLPDFNFDFYVARREVRFDNVEVSVDPDDIRMVTLTGTLSYNFTGPDSLTAGQNILLCDVKDAKVVLDDAAGSRCSTFKITGIKRLEQDLNVTLSIDRKQGITADDYTVTIPSLSGFRLLRDERVEAAQPYINLEFSMPVSSQQDLEGLFSIEGVDDLRIERNGTNVKIFYKSKSIPELKLHISDLIKNSEGRCLDTEIVRTYKQEVIPPAISLPFSGHILADNSNLKLPFRAVNLAAIEVMVIKISTPNVMPFLQENSLSYGGWEIRRFGRLVYHKTVRLDRDKTLDLHRWQDFSIDLSNMFRRERGAIYKIFLAFRKAHSLYGREKPDEFEMIESVSETEENLWDHNDPSCGLDAPDYEWRKMNWREADNPAKDSYYMYKSDRMPSVFLLATDLGLIVKKGGNRNIHAIVTDINTARPVAGAKVVAYNYQMQPLRTGTTDERGFVELPTDRHTWLVTASDGKSTTYLDVTQGNQLSTSNFDVDGKEITDGIKGFTYGDRGVWRPGDEVHLSLIIEDKINKIPSNHPVVMELYNPLEQLYNRQVLTHSCDGFYVFHIPTEESVPTGLWRAKFKIGNNAFYHDVRIETIKPNRLKIDLKLPEVIKAGYPTPIKIDANWLSGPVAKGLETAIEVSYYPCPTPFEKYKDFTFRNPLGEIDSQPQHPKTGVTDSVGHFDTEYTFGANINTEGILMANVTAKITERGGDASITSRQVKFAPFDAYVGIDLGKTELETDTDITLPVVAVNSDAAAIGNRELEYKIYKVDWSWWWSGDGKSLKRYVESRSADVVDSGSVTTDCDGKAAINFRVDYPEWGHYLVLVRDNQGNHATGGVITVDWPEWRGQSNKTGAPGSTVLSFALDKKAYEVGETASVFLPKCEGGRVLLSIENGTGILKREWVNLSGKSETKHSIRVDRTLSPNFYVSATMLRPLKGTDFDTPIRLFGIQAASVINPNTILHPEIIMPDELHPRETFSVRIKEKDNKPMTYTLAIVDEGLLDITNFKTPKPWKAMNQKEALGITTWDMFDDVIGSFGSNFRSVLSIGGDEAMRKAAGKEKRFNPVVKFMGPFTLKRGEQTHKITMPNYVGSVRVMVVAAHDGSYGNADKTVKVTSPLMVLPSLPRTLANGDLVTVPVNLLVTEPDMNDVTVSIAADGPVKVNGKSTCRAKFNGDSEQLVNFNLKCDDSTEGKARIIIKASGRGMEVRDTTFIDVSNPMPTLLDTEAKTLAGNGTTTFNWSPLQTDKVSLQIATLPLLNINAAWMFMDYYPHLCSEQLTSKLLFMLHNGRNLDAASQDKCRRYIPALMQNIRNRQLQNGGFSYWPGSENANEWVTSLVGLAMSEASRQGYRIDKGCLNKWKEYQIADARNYRYQPGTDVNQAFRLYSLAVNGEPQLAAMNRLRESKKLSRMAGFLLASAYAETGRKDIATGLIERAERSEKITTRDTFESSVGNCAIEMEAYMLCDMNNKALELARKIASFCNGSSYVTQDIALASRTMDHMSNALAVEKFSVTINENSRKPVDIIDCSNLSNVALTPSSGSVTVRNNSNCATELSLLRFHRPSPCDTVPTRSNGLKMLISYEDLNKEPISIDTLRQNTEFIAVIQISNNSDDLDNVALTYPIPSGWELWNTGLYGGEQKSSEYDYCDIRDNAVRYYFSIPAGNTVTFKKRLRAVYKGNYMLPPAVCENMYDPECCAVTTNSRVTVQ